MMKMLFGTRKGWLYAVISALIVVGVVFGILAFREFSLNKERNDALAELEARRGEYDEQSIVLADTSLVEARKLAERFGAALRITEDGKFAVLRLPEGTSILDIYSDEANNAYIKDMQADYSVSVADLTGSENAGRTPISPNYTVEDSLYKNQGYLDYVNIGKTWNTTKGSGVTVAVIDTGIDTDHPEFAGKISEYSYNATEDKIVKDYLTEDGAYDWSLIEDEQGHGTAVAGVIAAQMDGAGIVGIAPDVNLIVIKAECDEQGRFERSSDLVFALYYAIERDVAVVNMSFGSEGSNAFASATQLALDSDVICVAAAGNKSTTALTYPAADERVFGIGALADGSWELADYSNYGENVNLVAPGTVYTAKMNGGYGVMNGTSFSAPVVTAAIALYMSQNRYVEFITIREELYASCTDLGSLGEDFIYGYGALDISSFVIGARGTVTFNMLTDELENTEQIFVRGVSLQDIPEPERLYAVFEGWYYDAQCTEEYQWYEDVFTSDLTLYANWVNEDDGIPYTYVILDDGTVEIRSYTGKRRFITIPDMIDGRVVSSIGDEAFYGQSRLRRVTLPANLKNIGRSAFEGCLNLVDISIPATVETIGNSAFYGLPRLYTVIFEGNENLTEIGDFAFAYCGKLERIELPSSLQKVDGSAFLGATSLEAIAVRKGNKNFASKDGVLFSGTASELVAYPAGKRGEYTIPSAVRTVGDYAFGYARITSVDFGNVTKIGSYAFSSSELTSVTVPDSVTAMGNGAFLDCAYLKTVSLGRGLTSIPNAAFFETALSEITIPKEIVSIGEEAFMRSALESVTFEAQSGLQMIGGGAFACIYLESVEIPASVISIGRGAFSKCYFLSEVTFGEGSMLSSIGANTFEETVSLTEIVLPDNLRTIGEFAFLQSGLTEVTVPARVTSLGAGAFADCDRLNNIQVESGNTVYKDTDGVVFTIDGATLVAYPAGNTRTNYTVPSGVAVIGKAAFYGSDKLSTVSLPETLTDISEMAFYSCTTLSSISIPDNVLRIGRNAFAEDWKLRTITLNDTSKMARIGYAAFAYSGITSFRVPSNVSTMAQGAFLGCENLTSFVFAQNSKLESISAYMFDGCDNLTSITFESGSALTSVQAHGFEGMRKLTRIDFGGAQITNIDNFAFRFCESLQSITLPETVLNIGRFAFYECHSLASLNIPEGLEHIGRYAFWGTNDIALYFESDLMPLYLDDYWDEGVRSYFVGVSDVLTEGDWQYAVHSSGDISIIKYLGDETNIDLTALDLGGDIIAIGGKAFAFADMDAITLPETLKTIQAEAFYGSKLKSVVIPSSVQFIGREAFYNTDLETLTFAEGSDLRVMERHAFAYTKSLTSVTLPASLEMMGVGVFEESGISALSFENGFAMTEIPERAFAGTNLQTVVIPDCVTLINHSAFRDNPALTSVDLGGGEGLHIGSNVFYNTGLSSVNIPANVGYIGEYAFVGLKNLQAFTVSADNPYYKAIDGLLTSKDGRKLIAVPAGREGTLTVPTGVEIIGFGAFENSALDSILFDENGNVLTFGYRAFYNAKNITTITVPASVVSIDYYAFANCEALESVIFAEGSELKGIYEGAFYGCKNLSEITIPDSIVEISDFAFYGCRKITEIPVSDLNDIQGIYGYAFAYSGISGELILPETLIDIGDYAFMGLDVTSVTVPDTNKEQLIIGLGAFADCNSLTEITVPFIGASFEDEEISWFGYIFGAGGYEANPTYVPESLKKVTVTEGISFVGEGGFYNLACLEEISVPHSVTLLQSYAFGGTTARYELTNEILAVVYDWYGNPSYEVDSNHFGKGISGELVLAEGVTSIGYEAFRECNLESVTIPGSVTDISYYTFHECNNLTNVVLKDGITRIGDTMFPHCSRLRNVIIPDSVTSIGGHAFSECSSLTNITIPDGVTCIEDGAFAQCKSLMSITIPEGVMSLGDRVFEYCDSLYVVYNNSNLDLNIGSEDHGHVAQYAKLIVDKNGNKNYKDETFGFEYIDTTDDFRFMKENDEYKLIAYLGTKETVTLPTDINGNSYEIYQMSGVRNVIIPEGMTSIGERAFAECKTLMSISFSNSVTSVGSSAFYRCHNLTSVTIPEGVTSIGDYAFAQSGLTSITLPDSLERIDSWAFYYCDDLTSITIPDGVMRVGWHTFADCRNLTNVILPESVTYIDGYAFYDCSELTSITLPGGVMAIGDNAFSGCNSLESLAIPSSVNFIGVGAFSGCHNLNMTVDQNNEYYTFLDGVLYDKDVTRILFALDYVTEICIPSTVTNISSAFSGHKKIQKVTFESGSQLTSIGEKAFSGCSSLVGIDIPESVTIISEFAFEDCTSLLNVTIPDSVTSLGRGTFDGCSGLKSANIPDKVTSIENFVFSGCSSLETVNIPEGVTSIGLQAFYGCDSLKSITIPGSVMTIGEQAFYGLRSLMNVIILDGVTSICESAFYYCKNLMSVAIPSSMTSIGDNAFGVCDSLYVVYNNSNLEFNIGSEDYGYIAFNAKLVVDKDGNEIWKHDDSDIEIEYVDTMEGFLFEKVDGEYTLIAYLGTEETVTLPSDVDGNSYRIFQMRGVCNVIIPEGMTNIDNFAFRGCGSLESITVSDSVTSIGNHAFADCNQLTTIVIPDSVTSIEYCAFMSCHSLASITIPEGVTNIGMRTFYCCTSLTNIMLPDSVTNIYSGAFEATAYYNDPDNWENGMLYIGNHLIKVSEDAERFEVRPGTKAIADDAFDGCYSVKHLTVGGDHSGVLLGLTNLETLVITEMPTHYVYEYFGSVWNLNLPITLKNIVLTDGVSMNFNAFQYITGVTIFVEATKVEAQHWDENFPNWHNGNKVVYGDDWVTVNFMDADGELFSSEIYRTSQVIRIPYLKLTEPVENSYALVGWDIDGDGVADTIPATSSVDITAYPIIESAPKEYIVNFMDKDGTTILYTESFTYGEALTLPEAPAKQGYEFISWGGYYEGMTVVSDLTLYSVWKHEGEGHIYDVETEVPPTCVERGYMKHECSVCGEWYGTDYTAALGHSYEKSVVDPTCTEEGYDLYLCACGDSYTENHTEALGHSFGEWIVEVAPSCEDDGTQYRVCEACEAREDGVAPALGHDYVGEQTKAPTCTETGEMTYTCSCGNVAVEQTDLAPHTYEKTTCVEAWLQILIENLPDMFYGYEGENVFYFECADCKHVQTVEEESRTHSVASSACTHVPGDWTVAQNESCTGCGIEWKVCLLCEEVLESRTFGTVSGHSHEAEVTAPTCTEGGYTTYTCACGDTYTADETEALGHTPGTEANCTEAQTCTVCGAELAEALGHSHEAEVTEPTCTEGGYTTYTCACGDTYTADETEALGHSYGEWTQTIAPGKETKGEERRDCANCGHFETRKIAALGYLSDFVAAVNGLSEGLSAEATYAQLYSALQIYAKLTASEKESAKAEFLTLQAAIEAYNAKAELANGELASATEMAFLPITVGFTFLGALWFLLKKKLLIK